MRRQRRVVLLCGIVDDAGQPVLAPEFTTMPLALDQSHDREHYD